MYSVVGLNLAGYRIADCNHFSASVVTCICLLYKNDDKMTSFRQ